MEGSRERRIALFIDFENLVTKTGIESGEFDLQQTIDRLLERGKVVFRRAYCDWTRFRDAKENLHRLGVELVDVPASTRAGKNAADMRLTIDALELCYAREHIDTFVIASGDSDFVPLANKLRENDKVVIGVAVKEATSPHFVNACDEFIYVRPGKQKSRASKADGKDKDRKDERGKSGAAKATKGAGKEKGKEREHAIPRIAEDVAESLLSQATGAVNPSALKEAIVRKRPDFDEGEYGFSSFLKLLSAMEEAGLLRLQQTGRQWYVLPAEGHVEAPAAKARHSRKKVAEPEPEVEPEEEWEEIPDPE